jgi:uncharacterized protein YecE (DUF72 family)
VSERNASPDLPLFLGCPVFNCEHWSGEVYPRRTPAPKRLAWYSQMFNTVEGNSTFYGLPSEETLRRWCGEAAEGFHFCLKFPRAVSHECELVGCEAELKRFLEIVAVLKDAGRSGPAFLQLGPQFSPEKRSVLARFLDRLPTDGAWAVEVRHAAWFDQGIHEESLNALLRERGIDRVLFDSRPLFQAAPEDAIEAASQNRKPRSPVRQTVTASRPMLRLVGRNRLERVRGHVDQWTRIVADWIRQGLQPYVFTHAPDDRFAPAFARLFWERLCEQLGRRSGRPPTASPTGTRVAEASLRPSADRGRVWTPEDLPKLPAPPKQLSLLDD